MKAFAAAEQVPVDFSLGAAYLAGLVWIGFALAGKQHDKATYFLGNRQVHWFLAGISVIATLLSASVAVVAQTAPIGGKIEMKKADGTVVPVEGALRGNDLRFSINGVDYAGTVSGDRIEGVARGRQTTNFTAVRAR